MKFGEMKINVNYSWGRKKGFLKRKQKQKKVNGF